MGIDTMIDEVEDGTDFLYAQFSEEDGADIERRTVQFDVLAKEFACEVGKVGLKPF